eukprot:242522_1
MMNSLEWTENWLCQECGFDNPASSARCQMCAPVASSSSAPQQTPSHSARWEWKASHWIAYDSLACEALEAAFRTGRSWCKIRASSNEYSVNFLEMEQINLKSKFVRKVRRVELKESKRIVPRTSSQASSLKRKQSIQAQPSVSSSSKKQRISKLSDLSPSQKRKDSSKKLSQLLSQKGKKLRAKTKMEFTPAKPAVPKKLAKIQSPAVHSSHKDFNEHITGILSELAKNERASGNHWKAQAYGKAVKSLVNLDHKVTSGKQALKLPGVGKSIAKKIQEIIDTGKLEKLNDAQHDPKLQALNALCRVHGIGAKMAEKLYTDHAITSLFDLSKRQDLLSQSQKVGLKYVQHFAEKIPRAEVSEIEAAVRAVAQKMDSGIRLVVCGSFRRGVPECGDIDILVTHPSVSNSNYNSSTILSDLLGALHENGLLVDDLATGPTKYMGVCKLPDPESQAQSGSSAPSSSPSSSAKSSFKFDIPDSDDDSDSDGGQQGDSASSRLFKSKSGSMTDLMNKLKESKEKSSKPSRTSSGPLNTLKFGQSSDSSQKGGPRLARRIDIRFVPHESYPHALLYFTGSDNFNRAMRQHAIEQGFTMNEQGIFPILKEVKSPAKGHVSVKEKGEPVSCKTEEDIFKVIGWEYVKPADRNW